MLPEEREYRVGPRGFRTRNEPKGDEPYVDVSYEPGALVWLRKVPAGADLEPTGNRRGYETK